MLETQFVAVHGHRRAYVMAGPAEGPTLLLLHGLACDHHSWDPVIDRLSRRFRVIAPDLLGHGESDKPRADYSVGGYANGMRDLLTVLGVDKVTVVGHSFGGGVAMQFAYQFPERTERLILVDAGGLGKEVTAAIRAITLPFSMTGISVLTAPGIRHVLTGAMRALGTIDAKYTRDLGEVATIIDAQKDPRARYALNRLVNGVIDRRGQIVTMRDRAYLTEEMPVAVIWGQDDLVLPASQLDEVAEFAPSARRTLIPRAGHFPMKDAPQQFVDLVTEFVESTKPATYSRARWRALLKAGARRPALHAVAGQA